MCQEVTANLCLGTKSAVQEKVNDFFLGIRLICFHDNMQSTQMGVLP